MNDPEVNTTPYTPLGSEAPTRARPKERQDTPPEPPQLALVTYAGEGLGAVKPLAAGEFLMGRSADCHIVVTDGEVSRHHAKLRVTGGLDPKVVVEDLYSTNGTRVNEQSVKGARDLVPGDRLGLGGHIYKLVIMDELERAFHQSLLEAGTRDALTGLANRGAIMKELQARFQLAQRYDRPMSLILGDLDHFKTVNDTRGHAGGDAALRAFSEALLAQLREPDLAGRIGGEEFLILLPETERDGAAVVAERLRAAVEALRVELPDGPLAFTCSLGISALDSEDREPGEALARADAALYRAKSHGRNRIARG